MKCNFLLCLDRLLKHEGGFVHHPDDPGGITNLGITIGAYQDYIGRESTAEEMRSITKGQASKFYGDMYWKKIKGDELPTGLDYCTFDAAVNSGVSRASKWLQQCVGAEEDGIIGQNTLNYVSHCLPNDVVEKYCDIRIIFLKSLKHWETFGKGWGDRVNDVRNDCLEIHLNEV